VYKTLKIIGDSDGCFTKGDFFPSFSFSHRRTALELGTARVREERERNQRSTEGWESQHKFARVHSPFVSGEEVRD
jgi:hypothetical protein